MPLFPPPWSQYLTSDSNEIEAVSKAIRKLELNSNRLGLRCEDSLKNLERTVVSSIRSLEPELTTTNNAKRRQKLEDLALIDWGHTAEFLKVLPDFDATILDAKAKITDMKQHQNLLGSLCFDSISTRVQTIPPAHQNTFSWIFKGETPDGSHQIRFVEWLRTENGHFWIQGKAGSGKSTLMKFLACHPETHRNLKEWANGKPLVLADFFFWISGTNLQKSQEGLLRSLLFKILRKSPELVPGVCERLAQGSKGYLFGNCTINSSTIFSENEGWSLDELMYVYKILTAEEASSKFCFIIDGLDEFQVQDHRTHQDLIKTLKYLAESSNVKICLSSRPWTQFKDAFGGNPQTVLKLEDLTRQDIRHYVSDKFHEHEQYQKLKLIDPTYAKLVEEVVDKAQGVFLWVFLVVRDLLEGLTYNDSIKTMRARLEILPEDLEGFFRHMFQTIPKIYRGQTARAFQVALSRDYPLLLLTYACLDDVEEDPDLSLRIPRPFSDANISMKRDMMQRRLDGRTRGLLEIHQSSQTEMFFHFKIDFLHRTVRDFLQQPRELDPVFSQSPEDERQTWMLLCHATLLLLKQTPNHPAWTAKFAIKCVPILDELHFFASKALEDTENLQTVNRLLINTINPIKLLRLHPPHELDKLLRQVTQYCLDERKQDSNTCRSKSGVKIDWRKLPDPNPTKHGMSTTAEASVEKGGEYSLELNVIQCDSLGNDSLARNPHVEED